MSRLLTALVIVLLAGCARSGSGKNASNAHDSDLSSEFKSSDSDDSSSKADSDSKTDEKSEDGTVDSDDVSYAKKQQLPPGPACLDQSGSVQECTNDNECCKNFYCGIDPSGSPRQKVCLYGGS